MKEEIMDQTVKSKPIADQPYEPSSSLSRKIARRILPYQSRRILKFKIDKPIVSFTFDDFPRSALLEGGRMLVEEGWRGSFYVSASLVSTANHHGQNFFSRDLMDVERRGHEVCGHTFSHIDCSQHDIKSVLLDMDTNRAALQALGFKGEVEHFAFPFGQGTAELKSRLGERFKSLRGILPGVHRNSVDLNGIRSYGLSSGEKYHTLLRAIEGLKNSPGWLTLFAHDIREDPSEWGCTPEEFRKVVAAVKASSAEVLPIGQAVEFLKKHPAGPHGDNHV